LLIGLLLDIDKYLKVLNYKIKIVLVKEIILRILLLKLKRPLSQNLE